MSDMEEEEEELDYSDDSRSQVPSEWVNGDDGIDSRVRAQGEDGGLRPWLPRQPADQGENGHNTSQRVEPVLESKRMRRTDAESLDKNMSGLTRDVMSRMTLEDSPTECTFKRLLQECHTSGEWYTDKSLADVEREFFKRRGTVQSVFQACHTVFTIIGHIATGANEDPFAPRTEGAIDRIARISRRERD
eukprot:1845637-Prymnesium_polylepis.1